MNKKDICLKYKCDISTVNRIIRNKDEIRKHATSCTNLKQKRQRKGFYDNTEKPLAAWFDQQRQKNAVVSSLVLLNKAKEFALAFNEDFESDTNWLFRWRKRQNIKIGKIHGEISENNKEGASTYINDILPDLIRDYEPQDITNADESALYYKALPTSTHYRPDVPPVGHKSQKVRFTLLFICNSTGSFKRVYVIGKTKNPRCLKNVKSPIPYYSNKMAWMTTILWKEILQSLNEEMRKEIEKLFYLLTMLAVTNLNILAI